MMRPDAKVEKVYLYPKPVDFRKSIDGLAALVELDIKVAVFDPVLFLEEVVRKFYPDDDGAQLQELQRLDSFKSQVTVRLGLAEAELKSAFESSGDLFEQKARRISELGMV